MTVRRTLLATGLAALLAAGYVWNRMGRPRRLRGL